MKIALSLGLSGLLSLLPCWAESLQIQHLTGEQHIIRIDEPAPYILLPVQDGAPLAQIQLLVDNQPLAPRMDVRLARDKVDYFVPLDLEPVQGQQAVLNLFKVPNKAACWAEIKLSDNFSVAEEPHRPLYHHAPPYGWMNDPNGMFYLDGRYHLYYQYNPYGNLWGNMHWGHSSTADFVTWKDEGIAIAPDGLGMIFSGSCIVDHKNDAGFGKGAIIAYYTSHYTEWGAKNQYQSMAYSLDQGQIFTKYQGNPILVASKVDFRDPKVFYHDASQRYIMAVTGGTTIMFYSSTNMKDWSYESSFGAGCAERSGAWECPDLFPLKAKDGTERWVLLVSLNIGSGNTPSGSRATQYFIGDFDGKSFTSENDLSVVKWQDYGKDHYATVTWDNAPDGRRICTSWMTSSHYNPPTKYFRGINTIPRDLFLFTHEGKNVLGSRPALEMATTRQQSKSIPPAAEITFKLLPKKGVESSSFTLSNEQGNTISYTVDFKEGKLLFDRNKSGSIGGTCQAPIMGKGYEFRIFLDSCSVETFINGGRSVMSSLVFPQAPFTSIKFDQESVQVKDLRFYELQTKKKQ